MRGTISDGVNRCDEIEEMPRCVDEVGTRGNRCISTSLDGAPAYFYLSPCLVWVCERTLLGSEIRGRDGYKHT